MKISNAFLSKNWWIFLKIKRSQSRLFSKRDSWVIINLFKILFHYNSLFILFCIFVFLPVFLWKLLNKLRVGSNKLPLSFFLTRFLLFLLNSLSHFLKIGAHINRLLIFNRRVFPVNNSWNYALFEILDSHNFLLNCFIADKAINIYYVLLSKSMGPVHSL